MFRGALEPWHIILLVVVLVALFGAKRLPDAARSLGRSARVFRSEVDELKRESKQAKSEASGTTVPGQTVPEQTPMTPPATMPSEAPTSTGRDSAPGQPS